MKTPCRIYKRQSPLGCFRKPVALLPSTGFVPSVGRLRFGSLFCAFALCFFWPGFSAVEDLVSLQEEVRTDTEDRSLAQDKALSVISAELVRGMLGRERYQKERKKIESRIISDKKRYILSVSSSPPSLGEDGKFVFTVTVKVSKKNLKQLLLKHNLFYDSQGSSCVLPVISFVSRFEGGKSLWSWWLEDKAPDPLLKSLASSFFDRLESRLIRRGFYFLHPLFQNLREGTPLYALPKKGSQAKDFKPLAGFYKCNIVLSGSVQSGAPPLSKKQGLSSVFSFCKPPALKKNPLR